jgi:hypothetical protein
MRAFDKADCRQLVESRAILEPAVKLMRLIAAQCEADHALITLCSPSNVIEMQFGTPGR